MKNMELKITREKTQEGVKFFLEGSITSYNADTLQKELESAQKEGIYNILLNMLHVEYLSSTGIKVLVKNFKSAKKAGGRLSIETPSERVRSILEMVALDELMIN